MRSYLLNNYHDELSEIFDSFGSVNLVHTEQEMEKPYIDEYTTEQQQKRDKSITLLLDYYVDAYRDKVKFNKWYKAILFGFCIAILFAFAIIFAFFIIKYPDFEDNSSVRAIVQLISVCVTFLTLIVGILKIITKYVFPAHDEEYITRIVEIIQNNDLKNKRENIKVKTATKIREEQNIKTK